MNILVRLPNWLGDMVMSSAFVKALHEQYPGATIDLIAKKGIDMLLDYFPAHNDRYIFSKEEYHGLSGAWKFGKQAGRKKKYDLFFCLPDSLSSAVMAFASGAKKRVGYRKEGRGLFLTSAFGKKQNLHRVEEYLDLLNCYTGASVSFPEVTLSVPGPEKTKSIVVNINSEASSRRLPEQKAVSIINTIRKNCDETIFLTGGPHDAGFVNSVYTKLENRSGIVLIAGLTPLSELSGFLKRAAVMLSTDSGPAHLANAVGTQTVVLFGAGNEKHTAPFNKNNCTVIRLNELECEPCVSNTCKRYGTPKCLLQLDETRIADAVKKAMDKVSFTS